MRASGVDCIKCVKLHCFRQWEICKWNRMCQSGTEIMPAAHWTFDARVYHSIVALTLLSLSTWQTHLGSWWCALFRMHSHSICVNVWTLGRLSIARFVHAFVFVVCLLRFRCRQRPLSADRQFHFIIFYMRRSVWSNTKHHFFFHDMQMHQNRLFDVLLFSSRGQFSLLFRLLYGE